MVLDDPGKAFLGKEKTEAALLDVLENKPFCRLNFGNRITVLSVYHIYKNMHRMTRGTKTQDIWRYIIKMQI